MSMTFSPTMWWTTLLLVALPLAALSQEAKSNGKCARIKLERCQKEALAANREFVARYTRENVESFSVDLYQPPIIKPTRKQTRQIKQRYRNMFTYPDKVETKVVVTEAPPEPATESPDTGYYGTTVQRNDTCVNTTEREVYQDSGWIGITETIQCNRTDIFGRFLQTNQRRTRYEPLDIRSHISRGRRQVGNRVALCRAVYTANENVLYTVTGKGDAAQIVQVAGAYQEQGATSCTPASNIPRDIHCVLELVDSPRVVFNLRGKILESASVRLPTCTAYMDL